MSKFSVEFFRFEGNRHKPKKFTTREIANVMELFPRTRGWRNTLTLEGDLVSLRHENPGTGVTVGIAQIRKSKDGYFLYTQDRGTYYDHKSCPPGDVLKFYDWLRYFLKIECRELRRLPSV